MKFTNIFLIGIICLLLLGCDSPAKTVDEVGATPEGISDAVKANNDFAIDLYKELNSDTDNVFYSPWSIESAFSMVYEGSEGNTKQEISDVMHFTESDVRKPSFAKLQNIVNEKNKEYKLSTANALWVQENYPMLDSYLGTIDKYYAGKVENLNLAGNPSGSAKTINSWVEDQTNNKIKNLISPDSINSMTRLILTNAVYFKGEWVKGFEKKDTKDETFYSPNREITTPMMKKFDKEAKFDYYEDETVQVLEMNYKGDKVSMLVLLPKEGKLVELEDSLSSELLDNYKTSMAERKIDVHFPKFKFDTSYSLNENMKKLGMIDAFSELDADFSGIAGNNELYISSVVHKAYIDVNEKGTEAAAATGIMMAGTSIQMSNEFRADHPFIFIIQEKETGTILFMGKVNSPEV